MTGLPSEPMALVKDGTDSERTLTAFPLGINRADCISRQLSLMSLSQAVIVHSLLSPFLPSCSFRFPPLSLILYSLFENFHLITFRDILFLLMSAFWLTGNHFSAKLAWILQTARRVLWTIFLQARVLEAYSSRQSCLICPIRTSESRKIFPSPESRKAWKKGK